MHPSVGSHFSPRPRYIALRAACCLIEALAIRYRIERELRQVGRNVAREACRRMQLSIHESGITKYVGDALHSVDPTARRNTRAAVPRHRCAK